MILQSTCPLQEPLAGKDGGRHEEGREKDHPSNLRLSSGLYRVTAGLLTGKAPESCPVLLGNLPAHGSMALEPHMVLLSCCFFFFFNEVIAGLTRHIFPLLKFSRPILIHSETMGCKGWVSQASGEG